MHLGSEKYLTYWNGTFQIIEGKNLLVQKIYLRKTPKKSSKEEQMI